VRIFDFVHKLKHYGGSRHVRIITVPMYMYYKLKNIATIVSIANILLTSTYEP
jgi:hypothetical protein